MLRYALGRLDCFLLTLTLTPAFPIDHFTVVCLVAWPLNESEAGGELFFIINYYNNIINIRKAGRFLSKQGHFQPHCHSKARQLSTQP